MDGQLLLKSDKTYVDDGLLLKSDKTYVDDGLLSKSDKTYVDEQLLLKSDKTYVDTKFLEKYHMNAIQSQFAGVESSVALKANKTDVHTQAESDNRHEPKFTAITPLSKTVISGTNQIELKVNAYSKE